MAGIIIRMGNEDATRPGRPEKGRSLLAFVADYTVIDLETTGLTPAFDEIIEVAAIRIRSGKEVARYQSLVKPENDIPAFITELTGISNEMVFNAPTIKSVLPDYFSFLGSDILLGHNVNFDINFLYDYAGYLNIPPIKNNFIDTMRISRRAIKELPNHKLTTLCSYFGIKEGQEHRSLSDCVSTYLCYQYLEQHISSGKGTLAADWEHYGSMAKRITANADAFNEDSPVYGAYFAFTGKLDRMTRREAMQLVVDHGGKCTDNVVKKTNYLVLGNTDFCKSITDGKSNKQKKVEKMKLQGLDIEVISEDVFYDMIEQ